MFIILKPPPAVLAAIAVLTAIAVNGGESVTSLLPELEKFLRQFWKSHVGILNRYF